MSTTGFSMLKLSEQEIVRFLESDKELPEKYRFLLFEDKREVELVWNGKTNEVCNVVLPFQTIEQVDEPRAEKPSDTAIQLSLFDMDDRGQWIAKDGCCFLEGNARGRQGHARKMDRGFGPAGPEQCFPIEKNRNNRLRTTGPLVRLHAAFRSFRRSSAERS